HAVDRVATRLLQQLGVFLDLAATQGAQARHDVAAQAAAAHDQAEDLALRLDHLITGNVFSRSNDHRNLLTRRYAVPPRHGEQIVPVQRSGKGLTPVAVHVHSRSCTGVTSAEQTMAGVSVQKPAAQTMAGGSVPT